MEPGGADLRRRPIKPSLIKRASDADAGAREHMRVDLGRGHVFVSQKFLDGSNIRAGFEQVRRERMAQGVRRHAFVDARAPGGAPDGVLHRGSRAPVGSCRILSTRGCAGGECLHGTIAAVPPNHGRAAAMPVHWSLVVLSSRGLSSPSGCMPASWSFDHAAVNAIVYPNYSMVRAICRPRRTSGAPGRYRGRPPRVAPRSNCLTQFGLIALLGEKLP